MDKQRIQAFADKVYDDMAGTMAVGMAYAGVKTGLFGTMAGKGAMTCADVVAASGLEPRYVEEWLNGMAAGGYLDYDADAETWSLPDEHAYLLASQGTDHFMGGLFFMGTSLLAVAPQVAEAFATGGGVKFEHFGPDCVNGLDMLNHGSYAQRFTGYWLQTLPDVVARLESGGRALDFGCGSGRACIALAKAFPEADVVGLDIDAHSVAMARAMAEDAGLADRIAFVAADIASFAPEEKFDLICACDCVHDLADPHGTLAAIRSLLKPDGTLFVAEPKAADRLEDNMTPLGTVFYGFSIFHCMTQSLANGGPGLGTCMGPARTEALLRDAGFGSVEILDIKSQTNLFYAARV
ncbi:class I SAM-dependent methyltransferase [Microbaculum marinum]|uniref:Class I SAM-dependent methyltransferase n=1 Tax=Microbaculum marinum TaxID=1764581 RepID=A0AAW9RPR3_9HYPH